MQCHHEIRNGRKGNSSLCNVGPFDPSRNEIPAGNQIVHRQYPKKCVEHRPSSDQVSHEDKKQHKKVNTYVLVLKRIFSLFKNGVSDVCSRDEHEEETETHCPVSIVQSPVIEAFADVSAEVVNVNADDGHGED